MLNLLIHDNFLFVKDFKIILLKKCNDMHDWV